jgi:hypothetical protein
LLLLLAAGALSAAESIPPASGYPQVPTYEAVFVSSTKPLPTPPAAITAPVAVTPPPVVVVTPMPSVREPSLPAPITLPSPNSTSSALALAPAPVVVPVQSIQPPVLTKGAQGAQSVADALKTYQIVLEPPSSEDVFGKLDSEPMLQKRMRQQALQRNPPEDVQFPENPPLTKDILQARNFQRNSMIAEPSFVCYDRLYFEEKNAERYGWDLGFIQPYVSTVYFYRDLALLPLVVASRPLDRLSTSAGQCLPGDPVPYIFYPAAISASVRGASFGLIGAFP